MFCRLFLKYRKTIILKEKTSNNIEKYVNLFKIKASTYTETMLNSCVLFAFSVSAARISEFQEMSYSHPLSSLRPACPILEKECGT